MRWTPGGESEDIEDRRDSSGGGGGGGIGGSGIGGIHLGLGGTLIVLVLSIVFKTNLFTLFSGGAPVGGPATSVAADPARDAGESKEVQFVSFVLDDAQKTWTTLLPAQTNKQYRHAKLVLFRDSIQSACGQAQSATGPFYCPGDEKVYIDLGFFEELKTRFGAPGEFAQAYVIAHELGHHVQKILGIEDREQRSGGNSNATSVKMELQADCFAGIWANTTQQRSIIDQSDIQAGLQAAAAVGDDRLQKMATGHVNPESFTHGSSAQRMDWFKRGLADGKITSCDTFGR